MNAAIRALFWELLWKNRVVFPALLVLVGVGFGLSQAVLRAAPDVWWANEARAAAGVAFLASMVLGFAPFTLMESHSGWRMNSMTTRWFVLPVSTATLVAIPLLLACACTGLLLGAWQLIFQRMIPGVDWKALAALFFAGIMAVQALAWLVPRKPSQYWMMAAIIFGGALAGTILLAENRPWPNNRQAMQVCLWASMPVLGLLAFGAARQNRCGRWPGEIPLAQWLGFLARRKGRERDFRSVFGALFWSDIKPVIRPVVLSWICLAIVLLGSVMLTLEMRRPHFPGKWNMLANIASEVLPAFGVFWLAWAGLLGGCETAGGFRTRLSAFRATQPATTGYLAAIRILALVLAWAIIWGPLVGLFLGADRDYRGIPANRIPEMELKIAAALAWKMAISAHVLIGALPVFLRGRLEGFPNLLLVSLASWACTWLLAGFLDQDIPRQWSWTFLGALLTAKLGVAGWAFGKSLRMGQITWRFAAMLISGWLAVASGLIWGLSSWQFGGIWRAASLVMLVPLARLVCCPLALAANRHR